ncbi:sensor histidine kinase [Metabacillus malikii]|uniref:histidine kinase n=1 Tax=Metabacillus malikii TaxID=1504265 RepID=A0ABT9ZIW1_9BACI|nr:ATP-binding protein [Metabacillus malikii]MDQ0231844.1 two-component system sensor histidine kinase CiaH [Metabacillus malikii]
MFNKSIFKQQRLKFMFINLLAFTIIFTIFSVIIFSQVQSTLYTKTDEELLSMKEKVLDEDEGFGEGNFKPTPGEQNVPPNNHPRRNPNPRIIVLNWDQSGQIINEAEIGTAYYENYFQDYELDITNTDNITTTTIHDAYHFRYILFKDNNPNDDVAYIQLMINVDAEQTIIANFVKLVTICSIIFIVLSISASIILSNKMMKPIIASWNKQTEFVENASHELRTPLTIIQNKLEMMLTAPNKRIADKFENIALSLSETRRLSKLTSDLLTLARADSAETELVLKEVHVDSFIETVCAPYKEIADSQNKQFWLNVKSQVTIRADESRLHQLFVILLDNALKYTRENDSIGVKAYTEDQKIVFEISDTGIGIKNENMKYIFDRFYREDKARSRETGGMGLGLSIAHWIVTKHKGTIKVMKNQHQGTTFIVKLPK